jgi:hypothetical protein
VDRAAKPSAEQQQQAQQQQQQQQAEGFFGSAGVPNGLQRTQMAASYYLQRLMVDCRVALVASKHAAVSAPEQQQQQQQAQQPAGAPRLQQKEYMSTAWQVGVLPGGRRLGAQRMARPPLCSSVLRAVGRHGAVPHLELCRTWSHAAPAAADGARPAAPRRSWWRGACCCSQRLPPAGRWATARPAPSTRSGSAAAAEWARCWE